MGVFNCFLSCCTLLYVPSSFAIILMGKRELFALLSLSSWCPVIVVWLLASGAMGLSAVCDFGISGSYSLTICDFENGHWFENVLRSLWKVMILCDF